MIQINICRYNKTNTTTLFILYNYFERNLYVKKNLKKGYVNDDMR